jgi:hypothetical protein
MVISPTKEEPMSKTITQLKYLLAYYAYHHREPQDFEDCGGMAQFLDDAANAIVDAMPTADIEVIRPFIIDGRENEWPVLGRAIESVLIPTPEEDEDGYDPRDMSRIEEEHDYKFGDWRL